MSSLMVSNDLDIMMLEFAVEKLFVPRTSIFDDVIIKQTTVMFRMLDYDWISVTPHRKDYAPYQGSNLEEENFHGGKSVVFAIPSASLESQMQGVDIQIHVRKNISTYFEMESCQNVGIALVNVDNIFNGIIKELREREELKEYLSCFHERQPIWRSLKGNYEILDEDHRLTGASIGLYLRLSYLGRSVITEIETGAHRAFYAQEETNERHPYQCKELKRSDLEGGCWGSRTFLSPVGAEQLACHCDMWDSIGKQTDDRSDYSDDEKGDRGATDARASQGSGKDSKHSTRRRSTDGKDRRSNGHRGGRHSKDKPAGKAGKKNRPVNEIVDNYRSIEDSKNKPEKQGKKAVKGGDVVKGSDDDGGTRREEDGSRKAIHPPDHMEMFRDERESKRDVYSTRAGDNRGGYVRGKKKTSRDNEKRRGGSSSSSDRKRGRRFTDDDGTAKGHVGTGRKGEKTGGGAYVEEKGEKKRTNGIKTTAGKVEKLESVTDGKTRGDFKGQKGLAGSSRDQSAVASSTTTTAADGVVGGVPVEYPIEAKQAPVDAEGEHIKLREQLRKRRRGVVTVGLDDKEKKICQEAPFSPILPPKLCSNMHYPHSCYYPWPPAGTSTSIYLPYACFVDTHKERPDRLISANIADMEILTH